MNVTGIVLMTASFDEIGQAIRAVHRWISDRGLKPLVKLDEKFGGPMHPQLTCWGAGYNHFPSEEFVAFTMQQSWGLPDEVVLVIYFEHDPPIVFRPREQATELPIGLYIKIVHDVMAMQEWSDELNEPLRCCRCKQAYTLNEGCEPSSLCNNCAQEVACYVPILLGRVKTLQVKSPIFVAPTK